MNYNGEGPEELGELGDVLPAEFLKKLNVLLEQLHHAEHPHHGINIINIYAAGSQHVDTIINFKEREGRRHGTYTDDVVERAIIALNGKDKPLCEKQLFLAVIKVLASKCGWSSKWATSCDRLNQLPTAMEWEVKCDGNNLKAPSALKMDPAQIRSFYLGMQELLYNSRGVVNLTIENHYHGNIDQLTINGN